MVKRRIGWGLWLAAAVLLYIFENNTVSRCLLAASALLPAAFAALVIPAGKRLTAALELPEQAVKGGSFPVSVKVGCPVLFVTVRGRLCCRNLLTGERSETPFTVDGRQETAAIEVTAAHCGTLSFTLELSVQDVFGLFEKPSGTMAEGAVLVQPLLFGTEPVLVEDTTAAEGGMYSSVRPGNDPSETFAIREYVPGDPIRQIHWKLSEKTGRVMLRELGLPVSNQVLLVFDASGDSNFADGLDAMAEVFLSLSRGLMLSGIGHAVCWQHEGAVPELRTVEREVDFTALQTDFFVAPFQQQAAVALRGDAYAHVAVVRQTFPVDGAVSGLGRRVMVLAPDGGGGQGGAYYAIPFSPRDYRDTLAKIEL